MDDTEKKKIPTPTETNSCPDTPKNDENSTRKMVLSGIVVLGISLTWCGATQFRKSSLAKGTGFFAPFFLVWFNTAWMILCLPLYRGAAFIGRLGQTYCIPNRKSTLSSVQNASPAKETTKKSQYGWLIYLGHVLGFTVLWILANLTYCHALGVISATEVTALFASNIVFVYLLSFLLLKEPFYLIKGVAVLLAVGGIGLMAYSVGWGEGGKLVGIALAVSAAAIAATYKVTYKKFSGISGLEEVAVFLSSIGLCNILVGAPIVAGLAITGLEELDFANIPWAVISASAAFFLSFNYLVNFGISITHPLTVAVGIFLGLPLNAVLDAVLRGETLSTLKIGGSVCIISAFVLVLVPSQQINDRVSELLKRLKVKLKKNEVPANTENLQTNSCIVYIVPAESYRISVNSAYLPSNNA